MSIELDAQAAYLVEKYGTISKASRETGIPKSTISDRYQRSKSLTKEQLENFNPIAIPDGFKVKGVSTLYDKDGNATARWVKTTADEEKRKALMEESLKAMRDNLPREKPLEYTPATDSDKLSCYILTDYHIGQMSWAAEAGEDWGLEKSERFLIDWFKHAIESSPNAHTGVFAQLGDLLHYDSMVAVTPTSKHVVDTDARYGQIVRVAIRAMRAIINMMLEKHEHVHIVMAEGNHDLASSVWLRELFYEKYADEPRITVDNTAVPFYSYEWGNTSLFFHHGHRKAMNSVSQTFAGMYRDLFGRTKYSYAHMGHYHHIASKEDALMIVEQHPTMAVKDAHSAHGGYVSNRGAAVITYSKKYGDVGRSVIRPEMVWGK